MANDPQKHRRVRQLIEQLSGQKDDSVSGTFHFAEFLWFMQFTREEKDDSLHKKEEAAILESGYSHAEVEQFREIYREFSNYDDTSDMQWYDLPGLLRRFMHITREQEGKLKPLLQKVDVDGNKKLDFPEFLCLMRELQNENFKNINEEAAAAQHALEKEEHAVAESLFTQSEVQDLQKAFSALRMKGDELSQEEVETLLGRFVKANFDEAHLTEVPKDLLYLMAELDPNGYHRLDFPSFVLLMRWLCEVSGSGDAVSLLKGFEKVTEKLETFATSKGWITQWAPSLERLPPHIGKRGRKGRRAKQG